VVQNEIPFRISIKEEELMDRRKFLGAASAAILAEGLYPSATLAGAAPASLKPMELGLIVSPFGAPEATFRRVHELGFSNCFLSLDGYINGFTPELAAQFRDLLNKYQLIATTVEVVGPPPLEWNFTRGPSTIGLVPEPALRASMRFARSPTLQNCSACPRCRRTADLFPKTPPILSTLEPSRPSAQSRCTARTMDSIF
jgi:hypothetical protein